MPMLIMPMLFTHLINIIININIARPSPRT
jgi:hypothetical protein